MRKAERAPAHLTPASRKLWARLLEEFSMDDAAARMLLTSALEARDRAEAARLSIAADGLTVRDRFGQTKPHPLLAAERDAHGMMVRALRALRLAPDVVGDE